MQIKMQGSLSGEIIRASLFKNLISHNVSSSINPDRGTLKC